MKRVLAFFLAFSAAEPPSSLPRLPASRPAAAPEIRLVLLIAVDQFRYDYLTRFRSDYTSGFYRLLTQGAVFTDAQPRALPHRHRHRPRDDAVGRHTVGQRHHRQRLVRSRDGGAGRASPTPTVKPLGGAPDAATASPRRLLVSTVGDEIKLASGAAKGARTHPKVIGVSLKDRSAVMPVGRGADAAYWLDTKSGAFISSTYYMTGRARLGPGVQRSSPRR